MSTREKFAVGLMVLSIVVVCIALIATWDAYTAEAHILYLPVVLDNFKPVQSGCDLPDGAPCVGGPGWGDPTSP